MDMCTYGTCITACLAETARDSVSEKVGEEVLKIKKEKSQTSRCLGCSWVVEMRWWLERKDRWEQEKDAIHAHMMGLSMDRTRWPLWPPVPRGRHRLSYIISSCKLLCNHRLPTFVAMKAKKQQQQYPNYYTNKQAHTHTHKHTHICNTVTYTQSLSISNTHILSLARPFISYTHTLSLKKQIGHATPAFKLSPSSEIIFSSSMNNLLPGKCDHARFSLCFSYSAAVNRP